MKRRRRASSEGSLDLLLDTMCNAFGGIVLIAILVALLIESPGDESDTTSGNRENAKLLVEQQKQWDELRPRLEEIEADLEKTGELVELLRERNKLAAALSEQTDESIQAVEAITERIGEVEQKKATVETAAARLNREIASLEELIETQKRQEEVLANQKKDLINARKEELRAPVLGSNPGSPFNIIYKHGLVYPVQVFTPNRQGDITETDFNREVMRITNGAADPIPGKGLDPVRQKDQLLEMLGRIMRMNRFNSKSPEKQLFVTNLVFGDSFEAFLEVEKLIQGMGGIKSGWQPFAEDELIRFSSEGAKIGTQE